MSRNRAKCKKCGDIVESKHRHDFKWCKCGAFFLDGGKSYFRYGGDVGAIEWLTNESEDSTEERNTEKAS